MLKRALVSVLLEVARVYGLSLNLTRESPDKVVVSSYRKVMLKAHPDKPGGSAALAKRLTEANEAWKEAMKNGNGAGRPAQAHGLVASASLRRQKEYRIQSAAVLLTWQGFPDLASWQPFLDWLGDGVGSWGVKHWAATLESNLDGTLHAHAMLQFHKQGDRTAKTFTFRSLKPNASTNDLLGGALWGGKNVQQSVDRGFFYVWANKVGTQTAADGSLCVPEGGGRHKEELTRRARLYFSALLLGRLLRAIVRGVWHHGCSCLLRPPVCN